MEIFHLFYIRNIFGASLTLSALKGTPAVWVSIVVAVTAQFTVTYLPLAHPIFGTKSISLDDGLLIIAVGVVFFAILETEKQIRLVLTRG